MVEIIQVKQFDELTAIFNSFCIENNLPSERKIEFIKSCENQFNKDNVAYFLLKINENSKGFFACEIGNRIIRALRLYVVASDDYNELLLNFIIEVSKQLEQHKKEYLQIFFVKSLEVESDLIANGFNVFQRIGMAYDLTKNPIPEYSLNSDYDCANFTLERLEEELQIVIDANKNHIDGKIFRQFEDMDDLKDLFYKSNFNPDRLRTDSPIVLLNNKVVGINIIVNQSETASYVWIISLSKEHRGKGLGKFLMLKAHENCKKAKIEKMILDVTAANTIAYNLYKKLGYQETIRYLTVIKKFNHV